MSEAPCPERERFERDQAERARADAERARSALASVEARRRAEQVGALADALFEDPSVVAPQLGPARERLLAAAEGEERRVLARALGLMETTLAGLDHPLQERDALWEAVKDAPEDALLPDQPAGVAAQDLRLRLCVLLQTVVPAMWARPPEAAALLLDLARREDGPGDATAAARLLLSLGRAVDLWSVVGPDERAALRVQLQGQLGRSSLAYRLLRPELEARFHAVRELSSTSTGAEALLAACARFTRAPDHAGLLFVGRLDKIEPGGALTGRWLRALVIEIPAFGPPLELTLTDASGACATLRASADGFACGGARRPQPVGGRWALVDLMDRELRVRLLLDESRLEDDVLRFPVPLRSPVQVLSPPAVRHPVTAFLEPFGTPEELDRVLADPRR